MPRAIRTHGVAIVAVVAVFSLSRLAAHASGVRFDAGPVSWYWQFIDPELLKARLLESLYYLHSQPPLFNLLLGLNLKAFPTSYATALHAQFIAIGLTATVAFYVLLTQLGLSRPVSTVLAALVAVSPAMIVYENWLFYEYPTMALLLLMSVALHRFLAFSSPLAGTLFFALAAGLIYVRSVFQLAWLLAISAALFMTRPRRLVGACCVVPLVIVAALYAKNVVLFGTATTSSWLGMNLARMTLMQLDQDTREKLVETGSLHAVSLIRPFSAPAAYSAIVATPPATGIAVLDQQVKPGGEPNFNSVIYPEVSRKYLVDSWWVLRNRPDRYRDGLILAGALFFWPSTDYEFVAGNRNEIQAYDRLVNDYVYLRSPDGRRIGRAILAAYLFLAGYGLVLAVKIFRRGQRADANSLTVLFLAFTCAYVFLVSSMSDVGENQRIRFVLDPLAAVGCAAGIRQTLQAMSSAFPTPRDGTATLRP